HTPPTPIPPLSPYTTLFRSLARTNGDPAGMSTANVRVRMHVNGRSLDLEIPPHHTLLDVLRDTVRLTGTKECCSEGECGACTVLVNGQVVCSCLVLGVEMEGRQITTIEGLASEGRLDPLQEAFVSTGAVQCGFCIPGMIMAARA